MRFPGFEGEWEVKKLGEICDINPKNVNLPSKFIYIDLESVANGILLKKQEILKEEAPSRAQRILKKKDVLFQMVRPYQKNNFYFDMEENYVASTGYAQIRTNESSRFIFQYLHYQKFVDKVIEKCTGTSYPAINSTDLSNIKISYPLFEEQERIASFLTVIDERISTQNKIIEGLESLIKGLREKLFSQQVRFKDEDGNDFPEWEVKRLGDISYKVDKKNKKRESLPIYSISNINGFIPQSEQFEKIDSNERGYDISLYKIVDKETFVYNPARINVGSIAYSGNIDQAIVSSLYVCFKTTTEINDIFFYYFLQTEEFKNSVLRNGEGGVRIYLFYENFSEIIIPIPSHKEQICIAGYLSQLDKKIDLEKNILLEYEHHKKYFLQNLFI